MILKLPIKIFTIILNAVSTTHNTDLPPQELTEEGLPFVVLFHHPEDHNSVRMYKEKVEAELMPETSEQCIMCVSSSVVCGVM